jgi:hypothetical protein
MYQGKGKSFRSGIVWDAVRVLLTYAQLASNNFYCLNNVVYERRKRRYVYL